MEAEQLLQRCAWQADKHFRKHGDLRAQIWLTAYPSGGYEWFETDCSAPAHIDDAAALDGLRADMAADFKRDGVVGYAVAYSARVVFVTAGSAIFAQPQIARHHAITVEAHDAAGHSALGVMDIIRIGGDQPALGTLLRNERAVGRFAALLAS
jgi:hypothetical protein